MEEADLEEGHLETTPGHELVFQDITVAIGNKVILQKVSGMAQSGKLLAVMGPSGAGKSTLLHTLAGRTTLTSGEVNLDQQPIGKQHKRRLCYVLQQDIFFPNLTLRETLKFAAMLRISDKVSYEDKMNQLDEVVESLGLKDCLDTMVGGDMMPGLSGGERKRANIACEIMTDPIIILLDEPLTGLDASTAYSFIQMLKTYAATHDKIVITTVHQPSSKLFFSFDSLLLMCEGQNAYFGETNKMVEYFDSVGVTIAEGFNPADFILEEMKSSIDTKEKVLEAAREARQKKDWPLRNKSSNFYNDPGSPTMLKPVQFGEKGTSAFSIKFSKNQKAKSDEEEPSSVHASLMELDEISSKQQPGTLRGNWPTGFVTQYKYLTLRTFQLAKSRLLDPIKLLENLVVCVIFSLIWFQLPRSEETVRDRMGALFFIAIHWGFLPLFDAVASFPMERVVINKERAAGWYRLSAYYCAKMTSELPLTLLQPLFFVVISYWIIGLNGISAFFATIGTVFINSIAGQSIGLFLGIVNTEMRQAITVTILLEMIMMLLAGLFTRNLPVWLDWMKYLSFLFYSYNCLMYLEFSAGPPLTCSQAGNNSAYPICHTDNVTLIPSHQVLDHYQVSWDFWQYLLPLFAFILLFRALGYFWLRFVQKPN
uniref:ABC transporter G family member 22-like n=1 Tax=Crassostrea virginica TaxID=6565 RepID=A0A8B8EBB5_CRAVI|nr:ABC transporter G family member 22-like [Crassostrea virginica]XP_022337410.1 ABC transporter G family member 22-like [Crassostrea virginica]